MHSDGSDFMVDAVTRFFNTVRVYGWFHRADDRLQSVELMDDGVLASVRAVGLPHDGVASLGPDKGFSVQVLGSAPGFGPGAKLRFCTEKGWSGEASLTDLRNERLGEAATGFLMRRFIAAVDELPDARMLDIGGRARSGLERRALFRASEYVVFDVLAGSNVDVVGDAHELARFFPAEHFDAILSVSVFEHLMMPWTVVTQMNEVLKPGGLALVFTHQTIGMHDMPWDFWRFSDTAWDALFNDHTGFEILDRALDRLQHIIPMVCRMDHDAEHAAGFEGSAVLVRKTGPCRMAWPLRPADITATMYPSGEDPPR
jgi:SAM-dependent methyltransferase